MTFTEWLAARTQKKRKNKQHQKARPRRRSRRLERLEIRKLLAADPIAGAYTIDEGETLVLAAAITGTHTPTAVSWDLDNDGQFDDASGANATVHWRDLETIGIQDDGAFVISVQATYTDDGGQQQNDVSVGSLTVQNIGPNAIVLHGVEDLISEGDQATVFLFAEDPSSQDTAAGFLHSYDFDNDGTFEVVDTTATEQTFNATQSGTQEVRVLSVDKDGGVTESFTLFAVQEVAATFSAVGGPSPDEGSAYELDLVMTDPGNDTVDSWSIDWGDGTTGTVFESTTTRTHVYEDDGPHVVSVTATITDDNGTSTVSVPSWTVNVENVAPAFVSLVSSNDNSHNSSSTGLITLTGQFTDPGVLDTHTVSIDWGDGVTNNLTNAQLANDQFSVSHQYTAAGRYEITATVTDNSGDSSTQTTEAFYDFVSFDGDDVDESEDLDNDNDGVPDAIENIVATPEVTEWTAVGSTLSFGDGTLAYSYQSGTPTGWNQSANSKPFSQLGFEDSFTFSFDVDQASIRYIMAGINEAGTDDGTGGYSDIDHAIYFSGTRFYVYENGSYVGSFGQFSAGDTFAIEVDSGTLSYQRNGNTFHSRSVESGTDYIVDTSSYNSDFSNSYSLSNLTVTNLDGSVPNLDDIDHDGIPNGMDLDSDNDGISDLYESGNAAAIALDSNGDGRLDITEAVDSDEDGILDVFEGADLNANVGFTPVDSDGDGIIDIFDLDSDNDGIPDTIEARPSLNYQTNDGDVSDDDSDGDGVLDAFDVDTVFGGTHPNFVAPYTDPSDLLDTLPDYLDTDSDGDGIEDETESGIALSSQSRFGITSAVGANYRDPDGVLNDPLGSTTGLLNVDEDATDVDFRSFADGDGDGVGDGYDIDKDNDGILDVVEGEATTGEVANWTASNGSALTTGEGTFTYAYNSSDGNGWNQSINSPTFSSLGYVDDFEFSFQPDSSDIRYLMIGINEAGTDDGSGNYTDIDHAIYMSGTRFYVFENGSYRGSFGNFSTSDTFSIRVDGSVLNYQRNGSTFYTSSITAGKDYVVDTSSYNSNFSTSYSISNVMVTNLDGSIALTNDSDSDGTINHVDIDSDEDGETDLVESGIATVIAAADVDADGSVSFAEALAWLQINIDSGITTADANGDGLMDIFDGSVNTMLSSTTLGINPVDSNNDGTPDYLDPST